MVVICYAFGFFNLNLKIISDGSFKNVSVLCNPLFPLLLDWFFSVLYLHKVPTFFLPSALKRNSIRGGNVDLLFLFCLEPSL